jgi:hypothetical protein
LAAALLSALVILLFSQQAILSWFVSRALPRWVAMQGDRITLGGTRAGLFAPIVLTGVDFRGAEGSHWSAERVELVWSSPVRLLAGGARRWVERVSARGLAGQINAASARHPAADGPGVWTPRHLDLQASNLALTAGPARLLLEDSSLELSEDAPGGFRAGGAALEWGGWRKTWTGLSCATAWRDGSAYFSALDLGDGAVVDTLSVALAGTPAASLGATVFGGVLQAEAVRTPGGTKIALNSWNASLPPAGRFLGVTEPMSGTLRAAKLTFNGDPARPLEAQVAARLELDDFAWGGRRLEEARLGLSLAGRRLTVDEALIRQSANVVDVSGWIMIPPRAEEWRKSALQLDWRAEVKDLGLLAALAGESWRQSKGTLQAHGKLTGSITEGEGWLRLRGWKLLVRGVPVDWVQADASLAGRDITISGVDAWSGPNFLRGAGRIALTEQPGYQGRLELRVNEIARYLEPLGRFAPDWAREGGVLLFWDGDGAAAAHSGVVSLELVRFAGDLNPIPINANLAATYSPGNLYVSRFLLDRGPLSLSSIAYLSAKGLSLQDVQMFNGRTRLLRGEFFLPVSFPALLEGKGWPGAMLPGADIYGSLRSEDLQLGPLLRLFGQDTPVEGRVDWTLEASGPWENPRLHNRLAIDRLGATLPSFRLPPSRFDSVFQLADKRLAGEAGWTAGRQRELALTASLPVLGRTADGKWTLLDRTAPAKLELTADRLDLAGFAPQEGKLAGQLNGNLQVAGSLAAPEAKGALEIRDGRAELPAFLPAATALSGRLAFGGRTAVLEHFSGRLGDGTFQLTGDFGFKDGMVSCALDLAGTSLLLNRDRGFPLTGDAALRLRSEGRSGALDGTVTLTGGSWNRDLVARPVFRGEAEPEAPAAAPILLAGGAPGDWNIDVRVTGQPELRRGEAKVATSADMQLTGRLSAVIPVGTVQASGFDVRFPAAAMNIDRGLFHFTPAHPGLPVLDVAGTTTLAGHEIRALAWGPLPEHRLAVESAPPLGPPAIVSLLEGGNASVPAAAPPGHLSYTLEVR